MDQGDRREEKLHKQYTDIEEEYHAAYPDRPALWTSGALMALFSRYGRGVMLYALIGIALAVVFWLAYIVYTGGRPS